MAVCLTRLNSTSDSNHNTSTSMRNENTSSLKNFVKAKERINTVYLELQKYVTDTLDYVREVHHENFIDLLKPILELDAYSKKITEIREVLKRDNMKVVFFGRTSNGKSSVINAMLHEKILPNGIGHTTSCFLQVEGTDEPEAYLCTEGSDEKKNVGSVRHLGNALCDKKLNENQLVKIFWPRNKCKLLRDDVVFVDSPGIDVSLDLDDWIDKYCLDADVFVLVTNAESTLTLAEKNFFHKVSERLSKPNIFILNNRWDVSVSELEYIEKVREQHLENSIYFLTKELKVCSHNKAKERIFFISAKESLDIRITEERKAPFDNASLAAGFQNRYLEFETFERKFEDCISKSAVKTKFNQHLEKGVFIAFEIYTTMEKLYETIQELKMEENRLRNDALDTLYETEEKLASASHEIMRSVSELIDNIRYNVSRELLKVIGRLDNIVQKFHADFHENKLVLKLYKNSLNDHVENKLASHLETNFSLLLAKNIELSQSNIAEKITETIPSARRSLYTGLLPRTISFQPVFRFDCRSLCADFEEDLQFRFSWGISTYSSMVCRIPAFRTLLVNYIHRVPRIILRTDCNFTNVAIFNPSLLFNYSSLWLSVIKPTLCTVGKTAGMIIITGCIIKASGIKLCLPASLILALLYYHEWRNWTTDAKERCFKEQYANHVKRKLGLIVDLTADNCCDHVQREIFNTFSLHNQLANKAMEDIYNEIEHMDTKIKWLEETTISSKLFKNRATYVIEQLKMFEESYLNN